MLSYMPSVQSQECNRAMQPVSDPRYDRCFKNDIQEAVKLLCEFKEALEKLHPQCLFLIENMMQKPKGY